jgi:sn-glycerol 3-phosphate transport system substrate-binding protein
MVRQTPITRRLFFKTGGAAIGTGALAAFLNACGASGTATTASGSGGSGAATTAPTARPAGTTAAAGSAAPSGSGVPAGGGAAAGSTAAAQGTPVGVSNLKPPKNPNAIKISWWFGLGGVLGKAIETLTEQFNDSQSEIYVEAIYQGNYDDTLNKYKAGLPGKQTPNLLQVYDVGLRFMLDSKSVEPMQTLIDASKFDTSNFEPALLNYYSIDKKLVGMPFNSSAPLLYYNKKLFSEAGLDPSAPPKTWEDALTVGEKLIKKDATGKVSQYGLAIPIDSWYFEQWMYAQNALLVDNENGRANRATKTFLNGENGVKILEWWKSTIDKGVGTNLGRSGSETQKAFAASQIAMTFDSTAAMRGIVNGVGDKFEVGAGYLLRPAATLDQGGVAIGGAAVYIMKDKADREKEATWKFVQWLVQPEQQAAWHVATGYYPVRKESYNLPVVQDNTKKYPQFTTAIDQLRASKQTPATAGTVMGPFTQARAIINTAVEEALLGKATPQAALDKATADINQALDLYNASVR